MKPVNSLLLFLLFASGLNTTANGQESVFDKAIKQAQTKLVKVYGASAGRVNGTATGIIVSGDGQILTTQGVFLDGQQVRVVTLDGVEHQASIIRRNRVSQLALLKIQAKTPDYFNLSPDPVGEKGDWVVAINNAFKVADKTEPLSASLGVISLRTSMTARLNRRDVAYKGDLVLIDSITSNPGAAGGAVISIEGELIGMTGRIINSSETNTRLNYAVPSSVLLKFLKGETMETTAVAETIAKTELGIKLFKLGGRNSPAYIDRVKRNSPAADAKLKSDDLIITIAGEKVGTVSQYGEVVANLKPDVEVIIVVKRGVELLRIPITPRAIK